MDEFEVWIYRGLVTALLLLIFWIFKTWFNRINNKFDEMIAAINKLGKDGIIHKVEINNMNSQLKAHDNRLNDHATRIRVLEVEKK